MHALIKPDAVLSALALASFNLALAARLSEVSTREVSLRQRLQDDARRLIALAKNIRRERNED